MTSLDLLHLILHLPFLPVILIVWRGAHLSCFVSSWTLLYLPLPLILFHYANFLILRVAITVGVAMVTAAATETERWDAASVAAPIVMATATGAVAMTIATTRRHAR